jgi:tRNA (mo5U34)-methyltransferase
LWFHSFALAPGIYTPGIARDHGYRLAALDADRFADRSVLDVGAFDGFYSFLAEARVCGGLSRSTMSNTSSGCVLASA